MLTSAKANIYRILIVLTSLLFASADSSGQANITGPTCVQAGVEYQYTISGSWNSGTSMSWCITNGIITNNSGGSCKSGTPLPSITVIFNIGSTSGSVALTSSIGNNSKSVTVYPSLDGGTISTNLTQTIYSGSTPATISCSAAGGQGCTPSFNYQWQSSANGSTWTDISGAVSQNLAFSSGVTQQTFYRRQVTETASGTIGYSTNTATVFIAQPLQAGSITGGTSPLTFNTSPGQLTCSAATQGNCGTSYSYMWQISSDNINFTDANVTTLTFTPAQLSADIYFRVKVVCGIETVYSASKFIDVALPLIPGEVLNGDQFIAYNTVPAPFSTTPATQGNCGTSYTYQWQISNDNNPANFTDISGATGLTLTFSTALTQTKYYRRKVSCNGEIKFTPIVKAEVAAVLNGGTITGTQVIPYNTIPAPITASVPTGGICFGVYIYQWQSSTDGTTFVNIPDAIGQNLALNTSVIANTYYRRQTSCGLEVANTAAVVVTVNFNPGLLSAPQAINSGSSAAALQVTSTGGGNCSGAYTYIWEKSSDEYNWTAISGAVSSSYSPGAITATTGYRVKVSCNTVTAYTNTVKIKVQAAPATNIPVTGGPSSSLTPVTMPSYAGDIDANNLNYIRTRSFFKPGIPDLTTANAQTDKFDVSQVTEYYDGLGRPIQSVVKQGTPAGKDMIATSWYDVAGRMVQKYLPYTDAGTTGNFRTAPSSSQASFYNTYFNNSESFYYSNTIYENSKLNRVIKETAPGKSWTGNDRGTRADVRTNYPDEDVKVFSIAYTTGSTPQLAGTYSAGELSVSINTDDHENQVLEYKDKEGQVILKKVQLADNYGVSYSGWLCTYYIYDEMNRLRFVMQPKAVEYLTANSWTINSTIANEFCFRYEYDNRGRVIVKKVPGADEVRMVYDIRDRLVFSQDANMRANNQWLTTLYDAQNRIVVTGLTTYSGTQSALQTLVTQQTSQVPSGSSLEVDLILNTTTSGINQALNSVTLVDGFQSVLGGTFTAEIVSGPGGADGETTFIEGSPVNKNPIPSGTSFTALTVTYYDNYNWVGDVTGISSSLSTTSINGTNFITTYNAYPVYAQQITATVLTRGMPTGGKTKVIGTSNFLGAVTFYDEKSRPVQSQSVNYSGGTDAITTQYDFAGKVLRTHLSHNKAGANAQAHTILSKNEYDHVGHFLKIRKSVDGGTEKLITQNSYDELGQLQKKELGQKPDASFLEILDYEFNIRGWLRGINKDYANNVNNTRWFGMELNYDFGFTKNQFNGNIAGTKWRSKGDGKQRAFGYDYDNMSRFLKADFTQYNSAWNTTDGFDFSVSNMSYDANGNILTMNQKGWKLTGSALIDQLNYTYQTNTNKLAKVIDVVSDPNTKLGDFKDGANGATDDYTYDVNGNLTLDNNKAISSITYNHLNLPSIITVTGKGNIAYTYDAGGNKLKKVTTDISTAGKTITTTTTYIGGAVYESKITSPSDANVPDYTDVLQFIGHEEGRIRYTPVVGTAQAHFDYDYFVKDHLGNTRMVLTDEQQQSIYPAATLEGNISTSTDAAYIEKDFYSINSAFVVYKTEATGITEYQNNNGNPPVNNNPNSNTTANSEKLYRLNSTTNKTGLGITLKVMAGDIINIWGKSYYIVNDPIPGNSSSVPMLDLLNAFAGTAGMAGKGVSGSDLNSNTALVNSITSLLGGQPAQTTTQPKAFINWIILDDQFNYAGGGFDRVEGNGTVKSHTNTTIPNIPIEKNGYIFVFCSNESELNVFFDNLQVIHTRGPLLEETHYYPFGLTMAGISSKAFGKLENKKNKFQGQEYDDALDIDFYELKYRNHDPQIGRFIQIDPLSDKYVYNSTYAFSENKVTSHIELEGLEAVDIRMYDHMGTRQVGEAHGASEADIKKGQDAFDKGYERGSVASARALPGIGIGVLVVVQPEIGIPLAISYLTGVPVTPSPQAFAGTALAVAEVESGELLATASAEVRLTTSLGERAREIHSALPTFTQAKTTTAVASATTAEGEATTLVASSEKYLRPVQVAALKPGEVAVSGKGHAEVTLMNHADANGMKISAIGASRPICGNCAAGLANAGITPASSLKKIKSVQ